MTMTVQPRHIKLALGGQEKNWTYAAYELHELQDAFDRAARAWPRVRAADMIGSLTRQPMAALAQATKDAHVSRFTAAYGQLTEACNSCHRGANRGMIVIKLPEASMLSDQDFRSAKP
jgi:hypothetical protein